MQRVIRPLSRQAKEAYHSSQKLSLKAISQAILINFSQMLIYLELTSILAPKLRSKRNKSKTYPQTTPFKSHGLLAYSARGAGSC